MRPWSTAPPVSACWLSAAATASTQASWGAPPRDRVHCQKKLEWRSADSEAPRGIGGRLAEVRLDSVERCERGSCARGIGPHYGWAYASEVAYRWASSSAGCSVDLRVGEVVGGEARR